jgi:hypothetical protein
MILAGKSLVVRVFLRPPEGEVSTLLLYLLWGRSVVRLAIAALLYRLKPREKGWEPVGNF